MNTVQTKQIIQPWATTIFILGSSLLTYAGATNLSPTSQIAAHDTNSQLVANSSMLVANSSICAQPMQERYHHTLPAFGHAIFHKKQIDVATLEIWLEQLKAGRATNLISFTQAQTSRALYTSHLIMQKALAHPHFSIQAALNWGMEALDRLKAEQQQQQESLEDTEIVPNFEVLEKELLNAALNGDLSKIRELVENGVDVNTRDKSGTTPLHWAAEADYYNIVVYLVEHGANVNARNRAGDTPLTLAAWDGVGLNQLKIVKYLIQNGANINETIPNKRILLHWAASYENVDVVRFLVEHGADIHAKDNNGNTPLHSAVLNKKWGNASYLIRQGASLHEKNNEGDTPLYRASFDETFPFTMTVFLLNRAIYLFSIVFNK